MINDPVTFGLGIAALIASSIAIAIGLGKLLGHAADKQTAPCRCGHQYSNHEHYRAGDDCGTCGRATCPTYRPERRRTCARSLEDVTLPPLHHHRIPR